MAKSIKVFGSAIDRPGYGMVRVIIATTSRSRVHEILGERLGQKKKEIRKLWVRSLDPQEKKVVKNIKHVPLWATSLMGYDFSPIPLDKDGWIVYDVL